ncbi:MAG: substrate-binding domain-containing protein [Bacteroidales bacterium]|jgi:phosphate transport system substrate-binding protein|nr:substrate-binding domain-containing protein [Bacteroidales bacterium]
MKRPFIAIIFTSLIIISSCSSGNRKNTISISGAWALYPLAVRWAEEYKKIHPEVRIDISAGGAGKGMADVLGGLVEIGMVSREINPEEFKKGAIPFAVAKDAVVAVVNEKNPVLHEILLKGLTVDAGTNIWITQDYKTWGDAAGTNSDSPIHVYTRSDACGAAEIWALLFGKKQEDLMGIGVYGDPGLAQAVKQDSLGIGFNNIGYVYDSKTKLQVSGIKIVPLDLDKNGSVGNEENFYYSIDSITDAIASAKYPSPPARELYFVLNAKPVENKVLEDFIKWVLTEGQEYVRDAGYVPLPAETIAAGLSAIE